MADGHDAYRVSSQGKAHQPVRSFSRLRTDGTAVSRFAMPLKAAAARKDNLRAQATVTDSRALQAARFKLRDELSQDQCSASSFARIYRTGTGRFEV